MLYRRSFLISAAASSLAVTHVSLGHGQSPNDSIGLGFVGLGGRGGQLMEAFDGLPSVRIAALCDPDQERLHNLTNVPETLHERLATTPRFEDMRDLIEHPDVDAVVIATGNYWHCLAAIWACEAGKDVYIEKPLGHNLWEQQQLIKTARKNNCVVQVGTQQRSSPIQEQVKQLLHHDQLIGKPQRVLVSRVGKRKPIGRRHTRLTPPQSVNYNLWLGPALDKPIFRNELHYDWHWDFNTGNGEMGNWGVHVIDDALNVALLDRAGWPTSVISAAVRAKWNDASDTPNIQIAHFENSELPVSYLMSNILPAKALMNGAGYSGFETGYIVFAVGGRYEGTRGRGRFLDCDGNVIKHLQEESGSRHQQNFLEVMRSRNHDELAADLELGHISSGWCHLASIAALEGRTNDCQPVFQPDEWAPLHEGYLSQVLSSHDAAPVSPPGSIKVNPSNGEIASVDTSTAQQLVKREYRSHKWEREFDV